MSVRRPFVFGYLALGILLTHSHRLSADEGQVLTGAWNLYNDAELYRDFFEFIGPGSFVWVHLFFELLGPSYYAALIASWVLLCAGLLAFIASARLVADSAPAIAIASLAWLLMATEPPFINHNSYATYLALMFTYFMLKDRPGAARLLAGVVGAVVFFFLQPKGVLILCGGLIVTLSEDRRSVALFLLGSAATLAVGLATWGLGPLTSLFLVGAGNVQMNHATLTYMPLIVAIGLLIGTAVACRQFGLLNRRTTFLLVLQAALWVSTLHLPDLWHLSINAFPLLLVMVPVGTQLMARFPVRVRRAAVLALMSIVLFSGIRAAARNVRMTSVTEQWLTELKSQIGDAEFFAFTFLPSFYLELEVENPYFNSVLYERSHPLAHFERNVELLEQHRPQKVLADYSTVERYGHTKQNPVDRYLRQHYERTSSLVRGDGALEIWTRRQD